MTAIKIGLIVMGLSAVVIGVMAIVMTVLISWSTIKDLMTDLEKDRKKRKRRRRAS